MNQTPTESAFKPTVLVYFCKNCCGSKSAGHRLSLDHISETIASVHFKCAREVSPEHIRQGFANGADGILICGCLVRDCTNSPDDLAVLRSLYRNQLTVKNMGLATERLREEWVVQGTTDRVERIIVDFSRQLQELGPVSLSVMAAISESIKHLQESQA